MTNDQRSKVAELKTVIAATGTPAEVRGMVLALKEEFRRHGITARALAAAVGIHESTLSRWERETITQPGPVVSTKAPRRGAGFRVVEIAAAINAASSTSSPTPTPPSRGLRVMHAPSGLVVDGLDVDLLVMLLKRMSS